MKAKTPFILFVCFLVLAISVLKLDVQDWQTWTIVVLGVICYFLGYAAHEQASAGIS
jgi:1,4-dihydroxy-2-naphthoate octaprenyltransferase